MQPVISAMIQLIFLAAILCLCAAIHCYHPRKRGNTWDAGRSARQRARRSAFINSLYARGSLS